jgi:hypothetical protein
MAVIRDEFGMEHEAKLISEKDAPYLRYEYVSCIDKYNPDYGDSRVCICGHQYYRHFDSYENNEPCGCKYCRCHTFVEATEDYLKSVLGDKINTFQNITNSQAVFLYTQYIQDDLNDEEAWLAVELVDSNTEADACD